MSTSKAVAPQSVSKDKKTPLTSGNSGSNGGGAPVRKVAKRPANGARRGRAGAVPSAGDLIRAEMSIDGDPIGITMLIRQAARLADRLEAIDKLLSGQADAWALLSLPRSDDKRGRVIVEVQVDDALKEERAIATLFRHVVADIYRQRSGRKGGGNGDDDDDLVD